MTNHARCHDNGSDNDNNSNIDSDNEIENDNDIDTDKEDATRTAMMAVTMEAKVIFSCTQYLCAALMLTCQAGWLAIPVICYTSDNSGTNICYQYVLYTRHTCWL